jgi:hypothetical protein
MNLTTSRIATAALLVAGASSAYAGQPVATLACSGGNSLSINLSHFDLGVSDSTSSAPSSSGGTAVLLPLTVHASLGSFGTLFQAQAVDQQFRAAPLNADGILPSDRTPLTTGNYFIKTIDIQ